MRCTDWNVASGRRVSLDPWCLMGVVNATPDSFSDGGLHLDATRAVAHGLRLVESGASIVDVGGESTRPGAERVAAADQIDRVVPVIRGLRRELADATTAITVDTTSAEVAAAAFDAGADAVNDVSAGLEDEEMFALVAAREVGMVLMHRLAPPEEDSYSDRYETAPRYEDVVADVRTVLAARIDAAESAGISPGAIMVDPGFGFGKTVDQNFDLMRGIQDIASLGRPMLVGLSRKSFLGAVTGVRTPAERDLESVVATVLLGDARGLAIRVHDVAGHRRALTLRAALDGASPATSSDSPNRGRR